MLTLKVIFQSFIPKKWGNCLERQSLWLENTQMQPFKFVVIFAEENSYFSHSLFWEGPSQSSDISRNTTLKWLLSLICISQQRALSSLKNKRKYDLKRREVSCFSLQYFIYLFIYLLVQIVCVKLNLIQYNSIQNYFSCKYFSELKQRKTRFFKNEPVVNFPVPVLCSPLGSSLGIKNSET